MGVFVPPDGVQPADVVDVLAGDAADMFARLEVRVLTVLRERAAKDWTVFAEEEALLAFLHKAAHDIRALVGTVSDVQAAKLLHVATQLSISQAAAMLTPYMSVDSIVTSEQLHMVWQTVFDLSNRFEDVTNRILRYPDDLYRRFMGELLPYTITGQPSVEFIRDTVTRWLVEGVPAFVDRADRVWRTGSYVEMATRTAVNRAFTEAGTARMRATGVNLVQPIVGASSCDRCGRWRGRVLSTDGTEAGTYLLESVLTGEPVTVRVDAAIDDARADGFQHPNCRCQAVAFLPGIGHIATGTTYDPDLEARREELRVAQRKIRAMKRVLAADPTNPDALKALAAARKTARELTSDDRIPRQRWREAVAWSDGDISRPLPDNLGDSPPSYGAQRKYPYQPIALV